MAIQQQKCDFSLHERKARGMDIEALKYTIADCVSAARIHDEMDRQGIPNNSGRYWDEYHVYSAELNRRR